MHKLHILKIKKPAAIAISSINDQYKTKKINLDLFNNL